MIHTRLRQLTGFRLLVLSLILTTATYWPGLSGSWLFDDYPNIVDNHGVQPLDASFPSLVRAALSSPSSEFKRPLASLTFAANYLAAGLSPFWWKLSNLLIHLLNGLLVFLLTRTLLQVDLERSIAAEATPTDGNALFAASERIDIIAALVATGWMLLPINLTGVLYVVQRMESMANLFVLLGLIGYVAGRQHMLAATFITPSTTSRGRTGWVRFSHDTHGFALCLLSIVLSTAAGLLAKETAVMLPLYALLIEWILFKFRKQQEKLPLSQIASTDTKRLDFRLISMFLLMLVIPMLIGLAWLLPGLLKPEAWATRDFTLGTRLLSEARVIVDYIAWTLLPTPSALSFYHDDFQISTGLLSPWSTFASIVMLVILVSLAGWLRSRRPLAALGISLFLGCHLLTGTILPLELIYEHRNYFASFGLILAVVPLLAAPRDQALALPRHLLLASLLICWASLTAFTANAWSNQLKLAEDLASRAPESPRAQYELGRTYIIYSHYDPSSPFTQLAYTPLEKAAALPDASILAEQAMIFMNARMNLPIKDVWWDSLIAKLKSHKATVQDESSIATLTQCMQEQHCNLSKVRMTAAFKAALSHPLPSARLLSNYGGYSWNVLGDKALGERMTEEAVRVSPNEPAYRITLVRMLAVQGRKAEALKSLKELQSLNIGGRLNDSLAELRALPALQ